MGLETCAPSLPAVGPVLHAGHGGTTLTFGTVFWALVLLLVLVGVLWYTGLLDAVRGAFDAGDDEP